MRTRNQECKHCGTEYIVQFSGNYDITGILIEYQDKEYCGDCKKAIVEALSVVPRKFEYQFVETSEVDLETLERWQREEQEEHQIKMESNVAVLPMSRRIFAALVSHDLSESQKMEQVNGREEHKNKTYIYSYWPSKRDACKIRVKKRVNLLTGEVVSYKIR